MLTNLIDACRTLGIRENEIPHWQEQLDSLPDYHKKACALDALCQGVESWWA